MIVDILLNHMASPCKQAKKKSKSGDLALKDHSRATEEESAND